MPIETTIEDEVKVESIKDLEQLFKQTKEDDTFVYKAYIALSTTTSGIVYIPNKYILSDTYRINALEALATYFKKDISILI